MVRAGSVFVAGIHPSSLITGYLKAVIKGRHGSGIKGNIESDQNKSKVCSFLLKDKEFNPVFITIDTGCKLYFKRDNIL